MNTTSIKNVFKLGFPWQTQDPFLFCVHHEDFYPSGNGAMGPKESLTGRNLGNDFQLKNGYRMYHGKSVPGFPAHPHRGFETITIVEKGLVDHADSMGAAGRFGNGDVQWMTAGKGVQHSEMFPLLNDEDENPFELFQIWLNLPRKSKMASPHFKMLWSENIEIKNDIDAKGNKHSTKIITGNQKSTSTTPPPDSWAFDRENHVMIWKITMEANATMNLPISDSRVNRSLYFFKGETINIEGQVIDNYSGIELKPEQTTTIINGNSESQLLLLQGVPLNEKVVKYGPFVMNSESEIQQALIDFQNTQFGGWPWPKSDQVHDKSKGRFAKHADGKIETM